MCFHTYVCLHAVRTFSFSCYSKIDDDYIVNCWCGLCFSAHHFVRLKANSSANSIVFGLLLWLIWHFSFISYWGFSVFRQFFCLWLMSLVLGIVHMSRIVSSSRWMVAAHTYLPIYTVEMWGEVWHGVNRLPKVVLPSIEWLSVTDWLCDTTDARKPRLWPMRDCHAADTPITNPRSMSLTLCGPGSLTSDHPSILDGSP